MREIGKPPNPPQERGAHTLRHFRPKELRPHRSTARTRSRSGADEAPRHTGHPESDAPGIHAPATPGSESGRGTQLRSQVLQDQFEPRTPPPHSRGEEKRDRQWTCGPAVPLRAGGEPDHKVWLRVIRSVKRGT